MENRAEITLADQYAAALDWWRDAGVDCDFADDAQNWLADPEQQAPRPASSAPEPPAHQAPSTPTIAEKDLPQELAAFHSWWVDAESPLLTGPGPRIAPRGEAGAPIMLLVPMPEMDDREMLLSAAQGKMLSNIAKALGIAPDSAYFASALPTHMPLPDWDGLLAEGLGHAVMRHVELARPERVIVFGSKLPALLGHDPTSPPEQLAEIAGIPALATFAPERLLAHPRQRARLWQRLLEWTA